jgi:hypothetical protein
MREIIGTAMNVALVEHGDDKRLLATVECILVVSEPGYTVDCGELQRHRRPETVRFSACPAALRLLAKTFREWADAAEAAETRHEWATVEFASALPGTGKEEMT